MSLYEQLGIGPSASPGEIKTAYRRLVLEHHPDKSRNPRSKEIFLKGTEAYEVLSDPERRRVYDESLAQVAKFHAEKARAEATKRQATTFVPPTATRSTADVARLATLFAQNRRAEAEALANEIRAVDFRQPLPYAILGDIARSRGDINEAAKMYAYAAQFDPQNPTYQRRYEQLLRSTSTVTGRDDSTRFVADPPQPKAAVAGASVVFLTGIAMLFVRGQELLPAFPLISTWSGALLGALILSGLVLGISLSLGKFIDRFSSVATTSVGSMSPAVALALVSLINFWLAAILYLIMGAAERSFNYSLTRLTVAAAASLLFLAVCGSIAGMALSQVVLWGGNVMYLMAMLGWVVADAFRGEGQVR